MKTFMSLITVLLVSNFIFTTNTRSEIIFEDNFDSYTNTITGWSTSDSISLQNTGGINNSKCARAYYTRSGTTPYWFSKSIADRNLSEVYVRFYFKVDNPSGGSKFLKLFGVQNSPAGYANTTFAINYYSGTLQELSYGSGSGTLNDTQDIIRYNGYKSDSNVNIQYASNAFDPRDGQWHCFEAHMKYNDNGQRNGIYQVWIDGQLRLHATNVVNRNDLNSRFFSTVDLANYCHSNFSTSWNLWYDNVVISTTPIGTIGSIAQANQVTAPTLTLGNVTR